MKKEMIFELYNENHNTIFSSLQSHDIDFLLKLLEHYYIPFRQKLMIPRVYSFGFEYEAELLDRIQVLRSLYKDQLYPEYQLKDEYTIINGGEIATPILHNLKIDWKKVEKVLEILSKNGRNNEYCGSHIHIGTHIMNNQIIDWENFFMVWSIYEDIITRFLNGEYINTRANAIKYAKPVRTLFRESVLSDKLKRLGNELSLDFKEISVDRYMSVNLNRAKNSDKERLDDTIEFRGANGTFNPIIWQNNLNMILHLLLCAKNLDHDSLLDKLKKINCFDASKYSNINLLKALEFCDLIYTNNFDKINFLRQYFKDFRETSKKDLVKSKPFTC